LLCDQGRDGELHGDVVHRLEARLARLEVDMRNAVGLLQQTVQELLRSDCGGGKIIDYRPKNERFPVLASCVTISNPYTLSSNERGVIPGI
jgi:hypothetical protein